jgi:hypothetical protein
VTTLLSFDGALDRLEALDCRPRLAHDGQAYALCPGHDDRVPSLSITEGEKLLIKCFAECSFEHILRALTEGRADYQPDPERVRRVRSRPRAVFQSIADYHYTALDGTPLLKQRGRYLDPADLEMVLDPKTFRVWHLNGGAWAYGEGGHRCGLYDPHGAVTTAIESGQTLWITEGEKDADRLSSLGALAVSPAHGAGVWYDEWTLQLAMVKDIAIVSDDDRPGREHARRVGALLAKVGHTVQLRLPLAGKDLSDHLDAQRDLSELREMPPEPDSGESRSDGKTKAKQASVITAAGLQSWRAPRRTIYVPGLVEAGATLIGGMPKWGKSYTALDLGCGVATKDGMVLSASVEVTTHAPVVYADFEAGPELWKARLNDILGDDAWPDDLILLDMRGFAGADAIAEMERVVDAVGAGVLIVDTFGRWRLLEGKNGYQADVEAMSALVKITYSRPKLAQLVLTHTNQMPVSDDNWITAFSGTNGIIGVPDTLVLGTRASVRTDEGMVRITGRYHANNDWMLTRAGKLWRRADGPMVPPRFGERSAEIIRAVFEFGQDGCGAADLEGKLSLDRGALDSYLRRLAANGQLRKLGRGRYVHPDVPHEDPLSDVSDVSDSATEPSNSGASSSRSDTSDTSDTTPGKARSGLCEHRDCVKAGRPYLYGTYCDEHAARHRPRTTTKEPS